MLWPPPPPTPPVVRAVPGDEDLPPLEATPAERKPLSAKPRMCPTGEAGETSESGRRMLIQVPRRIPACLRMRGYTEAGELSTTTFQKKKKHRGSCTDPRITKWHG